MGLHNLNFQSSFLFLIKQKQCLANNFRHDKLKDQLFLRQVDRNQQFIVSILAKINQHQICITTTENKRKSPCKNQQTVYHIFCHLQLDSGEEIDFSWNLEDNYNGLFIHAESRVSHDQSCCCIQSPVACFHVIAGSQSSP